MSFLTVIRPGPMVSVQDRGRYGLLDRGVSASGPMDAEYLAIANALVGNRRNEAALEFAGFGGDYRAEEDVLVAVLAPGCSVRCGDRPLPVGESGWLRAGETLRVGQVENGIWGYIAISGGIETPTVLGSRATHLRSGLGGLAGRKLAAGDRLPLGERRGRERLALPHLPYRMTGPIRVIPGPQDDYFDEAAWQTFLRSPYTVTVRSDRMGMQLDGSCIQSFRGHDIISDVTPLGAVQVPGTGLPVILLAERQPTGGYPKIATVASVDLPRLVQMRPGETVRFQTVTQAQAESLLLNARQELEDLLRGLRAPRSLEERLNDENLISGIWFA